MTIPALPPLPKGENWQEWAKELRDYLLVERSKVGAATPTTPILRHRMSGESAAENGVLVFDPSGKRIEVSIDGSFEPVTIDADLGTIASQDADNVTITGGDITGLGSLGMSSSGLTRLTIDSTGGDTADVTFFSSGALKGVIGWNSTNGGMVLDNRSGADWRVENSGSLRYLFETDGGLNAPESIVKRSTGDARYLLESNNLSDLDSASTARSNLGLGTMATEATGSYATATALSNLEAEVDERTIGGATINANSYTTTTRAGGVSYQNNNGNMMMVIITGKSGDATSGYFQLSSNGSTWMNVAPFEHSGGTVRICSFVVPAGWYYRASRALDTASDRWTEIY